MFIGHFALGYAAKRWAPRLSLAVLFGAAVFADVLWPVLVALGIEHVRIVPGIPHSRRSSSSATHTHIHF